MNIVVERIVVLCEGLERDNECIRILVKETVNTQEYL
jgi:hypothetical protein